MRFSWNNSNGRADPQLPESGRSDPGFAKSEDPTPRGLLHSPKLLEAKVRLHHKLIDDLNLSHIEKIPRSELRLEVQDLISEYVSSERIPLNSRELGEFIDEVIDESGMVRDHASEDLANIRLSLFRKRNELRRVFDRILSKLGKSGYVADIEE